MFCRLKNFKSCLTPSEKIVAVPAVTIEGEDDTTHAAEKCSKTDADEWYHYKA